MQDAKAEEDKTVKEKIFAPLFFRRVYLCLHMKWILVDACFRCFCFAISFGYEYIYVYILSEVCASTFKIASESISGRVESIPIRCEMSKWNCFFFIVFGACLLLAADDDDRWFGSVQFNIPSEAAIKKEFQRKFRWSVILINLNFNDQWNCVRSVNFTASYFW